MRILIVDHYYPAFADGWYGTHPGLDRAPYAEQRRSFESSLFGGTGFEVAAIRELGHEADVVITNTRPAQLAWAREHGIRLTPERSWRIRRRRRVVPWVDRVSSRRWVAEAVLAQVEAMRPDVVHVQNMNSIDLRLLPEIRSRVSLLTGQIAAPLPMNRATAGYDLVVSSLPNFVHRFREAGVDAEWLPLAFEPSVIEALGPLERDVPVSFVGSVQRAHGERGEILDRVAAAIDVDVWTPDAGALAPDSQLRRHLHPAVWGAEMYRVLGRSRITINTHIDVAEGYANNLRLYEATGMGALLVTDDKVNLRELFEVGREVVAYRDATDLAEKVRWYLEHPAEAATIAAAGRERTLRDHTWRDRMARLVAMFEARM